MTLHPCTGKPRTERASESKRRDESEKKREISKTGKTEKNTRINTAKLMRLTLVY